MSTGKMAAVLAALAIFGAALGTRVCFAAESELTLCSYYSGGGMSGGHLYMKLWGQKDGTARATLDWLEENGAPEIHRAVDVPREKLDEIAAMFNRDDLFRWEKAPPSELIALDADNVSVEFCYADGSGATLHSGCEMPREAFAVMRKVQTFLGDMLKDAPQVEKEESAG